jgi:hypothetical protein
LVGWVVHNSITTTTTLMEVLKEGTMSVCFTRCDVILLCYDTFRANIPVEREDLGEPLSGLAQFLYNTSLHFCFLLPWRRYTPIPQHIHVFAPLYWFPPHFASCYCFAYRLKCEANLNVAIRR